MIHVCFALYDKAGHYSKFLGTAMLSLFENIHTPPTHISVFIHLLHDNTLTDDNRDKLIQIAERYGAPLKFYNVEELCAERMEKIKEFFPNIFDDRHSIAMFYRLFIPHLLLPQRIEKVIYLDADIIVNLDINELWQIELGDKPFGAVPEVCQHKNKKDDIKTEKNYIKICEEGIVNLEDYLNSGILLMNLKILREEEDTISTGMKFISEHPQFTFLDQDLLNYCFSTTYLKLPLKFNRFVLFAKRENEWTIQENIYHFAASRMCFVMDSRDPFNQLFWSSFIKTPWIDEETRIALSGGISIRRNHPISVVIPLYNMEEYISECLESLLLQTFQDFEVIVVDDCSTDNSISVVESYKDKFNGRLKLVKTKINSGGGGYVPRNIGMMLACGEYVYFLDADDMILGTALESLYEAAIFYDAEVVYTSSQYRLNAPNDVYLSKDGTTMNMSKINTDFTINDPNKNLSRLLNEQNGDYHTPWTRFCRRDFLIKNKIFFPHISHGGDHLWCISVYCHAMRFLRISTPVNLHRTYNENSVTRRSRDSHEQWLFWFSDFANYVKAFLKIKRENEVLAENPFYALSALKQRLNWYFSRTENSRKELDSKESFKVLYDEFSKGSSDLLTLLLPFFFSLIKDDRKNIDYYSEMFNKFNHYFTIRIDIKFMSSDVDFQILSVSDNKAKVYKPSWLQKNGSGYQIQSYEGKLEFIVKATANGRINLKLRGLDVKDPEDNAKRLPYWIDYTRLTINRETIFDAITPIWHDKPYNHIINVKADEEIKIEVEWLPHRDTRVDVSEVVAKVSDDNIEKLRKSEALVSELNTALNNAKKDADEQRALVAELRTALAMKKQVNNVDVELMSKFKNYFTARIDIRLMSPKGDFQILSVSDDRATISKPDWFQKDSVGYQIQSCVGKLKLIAKTDVDGRINFGLKGPFVCDSKDPSKHLPYWIDYTKLIINDKVVFDALKPAWHDKPYFYNMNVKAGEEITVQVEWLPHRSDA